LDTDGKTVLVYNSGRILSANGQVNDINGTAFQPDPQNAPGRIIVNFPGTPQSSEPNCKYFIKNTLLQPFLSRYSLYDLAKFFLNPNTPGF